MKKLSQDELLNWLDYWEGGGLVFDRELLNSFEMEAQAYKQIRQLIEVPRPKVSREEIGYCIGVDGLETEANFIGLLKEAGVDVRE